MPFKNNICIELFCPEYVSVQKDSSVSYGGSQMWFSDRNRYSKDYILHNYGCGTIATADLFLYLAQQKKTYQTPVTALAINDENEIDFANYTSYVHTINKDYAKTQPVIAVLGPSIASAINSYSDCYGLGLKAAWKWTLNYYEMYDLIEEMLWKDLPVILSIGPNTPKFWGKKGIPFYELREIDYQEPEALPEKESTDPELEAKDEEAEEKQKSTSKPYYYQAKVQNVCGHYVTVTALIKDELTGQIMLRISSWGKQYYINYEEYRNYIEYVGGTFTSSIVYMKENY